MRRDKNISLINICANFDLLQCHKAEVGLKNFVPEIGSRIH